MNFTINCILGVKHRYQSRVLSTFQTRVNNMAKEEKANVRTLPNGYYPPINRDVKAFDPKFFVKKFDLVAVFFPDSRKIQEFVRSKAFKADFLHLRGVSNIVQSQINDAAKVVLLKDEVKEADVEKAKSALSPETYDYLKSNKAQLEPYKLTLSYDFWKADEILGAVLPEDLLDDVPSGFTNVGHIAHVNLNKDYLPYKNIIGQVILDKNPKIRTVVNKIDTIATEFRTFPMEVIAGETNFDVEQHELNCVFQFNFKDVYWNSRLQTEHLRLTKTFKKGEVVFDAMAGVGPFAIPAAKNQKACVIANDLNPASYKYLSSNTVLNRVSSLVDCYNLDGAEAIKRSPELLMDFYKKHNGTVIIQKAKKIKTNNSNFIKPAETIEISKHISHYVMNLPDSALTFLDNYIGVLNNHQYQEFVKNDPNFKLPKIHVYCFEKWDPVEHPTEEELHTRVQQRIEKIMSYKFEPNHLSFHLVRSVSPSKAMFCVSFVLPKELAYK